MTAEKANPDAYLVPLREPAVPDPAAWQRAFDELHSRVEQLLDYCDGLDRAADAGAGTLTTSQLRKILGVTP